MTEEKRRARKFKIRKKINHYAFVIITFTLIGLYFLLLLPPQEVKTIQATALKLSAVQTDEGSKLFMLIELEDGKTVKARMLRKFPFVKGAKVTVTRKKLYIGFTTYSILWNTKEKNKNVKN